MAEIRFKVFILRSSDWLFIRCLSFARIQTGSVQPFQFIGINKKESIKDLLLKKCGILH